MTKKNLLTGIVISLMLILLAAPQAFAIEIEVTPSGTIFFYEDGVLGDSTDSINVRNKAVNIVQANAGQRLRVERGDRTLRVQTVQDSVTPVSLPETGTTRSFQNVNQVEANRVQGVFPSGITEEQLQKTRDERQEIYLESAERRKAYQQAVEDRKAQVESSSSNSTDNYQERINEARSQLQDRVQQYSEQQQRNQEEYLNRLQEERRERLQERLELRSLEDEDGQQQLQIESRNVRANLRGADFEFDPETNQVTLTTPSGQEKTLNHLPDQAIDRLSDVTNIRDGAEVDVETDEDGNVLYSAPGTKRKRVFGIFGRNVNTRVYLDDDTGEVQEVEVPSPGILGQFLDVISQ